MPEVTFRIRWPDGQEETCYSPSTTIREAFRAGESYSITEFKTRAVAALDRAAQRVEAKYGFRCSSADDQSARLRKSAKRYRAEEIVQCLSMS